MATRHEFNLEMTCEGCSNAAKRVLGKVQEVTKVEIDMEKQRVFVTSTKPADELLEVLKKTGKACDVFYYDLEGAATLHLTPHEIKPQDF